MTDNYQLFVHDPRTYSIPNDGVAKVGEPQSDSEWDVLRYELRSFVCEGEYETGLERILASYLTNLDNDTQPAAWVSGFYGSGKSHLVRVLEHLWRDTALPDGASARGLVTLPSVIDGQLTELTTQARRHGVGLFAASGNLGAEKVDQLGAAFLAIVFRAASLPEQLAPARLALWLHQEGLYASVAEQLTAAGQTMDRELRYFNLSESFARALLAARPELAGDIDQLRSHLRAQFPESSSVSSAEVERLLRETLELVSQSPGKIPLSLIVLDEVQLYIAENAEKAKAVQDLVEACSSRFGSRLLVVATGQAELTETPTLQKIKDRFSVRFQLRNQDIDAVVRRVVLRKEPARVAELSSALDAASGEVTRELTGSRIAHREADDADLVADYPVLPARRRFWDAVLRAADSAGKAGQLRSQLRVVHDANRSVAGRPVGTVVAADYVYTEKADDMHATGVLLKEQQLLIEEQRGRPDGELRARLLALVFLIGLLPSAGEPADVGVRASAAHLADLLVEDLSTDGARLRGAVPAVLEALVGEGVLQQVGDSYRLQTAEDREWLKALDTARAQLSDDYATVAAERLRQLRMAFETCLPRTVPQGDTGRRKVSLHLDDSEPSISDTVPVWVRTGWDTERREFDRTTRGADPESPIVFAYVARDSGDQLSRAIVELLASERVLTRPAPTTETGRVAHASMRSRAEQARRRVQELVVAAAEDARVELAGGAEAEGDTTAARLGDAARRGARRLYPLFGMADANWSKVVTRAKEGGADGLLAAIGYDGDVVEQPAVKAVMGQIASTWTPAGGLATTFAGRPYGWDLDVLKGVLCALVGAGAVSAQIDGRPASPRDIAAIGGRLGKLEVRRESAALSTADRITARGVLTQLGLTIAPDGDLVVAADAAIAGLQQRALALSGPPPLGSVTVPDAVDRVARAHGNEQILALVAEKKELVAFADRLEQLESRRAARAAELTLADRLAQHAEGLPAAQKPLEDLAAARAGDALLVEVDPIGPIVAQLSDVLRAAVTAGYAEYEATRARAHAVLEADSTFVALKPPVRQELLGAELQPLPPPTIGTPDELVAELDRRRLSDWPVRIAAVGGRVAQLRHRAAELGAPQAVPVGVPASSGAVSSERELADYLEQVGTTLRARLAEHGTIVVRGS